MGFAKSVQRHQPCKIVGTENQKNKVWLWFGPWLATNSVTSVGSSGHFILLCNTGNVLLTCCDCDEPMTYDSTLENRQFCNYEGFVFFLPELWVEEGVEI